MTQSEPKTSPLWIAMCWTVVLIPLGWGVYQSLKKSIPLFDTSATSKVTADHLRQK